MKNVLRKVFTGDLKTREQLLIYSVFFTFIFGSLAHMFAFTNLQLSHDSLNEFSAFNTIGWKVMLGRFMHSVLRFASLDLIIKPWVAGMLSLMLVSCSVYLTGMIFGIKKKYELILTAAFFATSATITCLAATFMEDLVADMSGLLLALLAVYQWIRLEKAFRPAVFIAGIVYTTLAIAFYQSYLSVTVVAIMIYSIMKLMQGACFGTVFKRGCIAIGMILLGGILYLGIVRVICLVSGIELASTDYNSLSRLWSAPEELPRQFIAAYTDTLRYYFKIPDMRYIYDTAYPDISVLAAYPVIFLRSLGLVLSVILFVRLLFIKKLHIREKLLAALLLSLIPAAANLTMVLTAFSDELTTFAYVFYPVGMLFLFRTLPARKDGKARASSILRPCAIGLMCFFVLNNIQVSNACYTQKELVERSTHSLMTRVLARIEEHPDYTFKKTRVAFVGRTYESQVGVPATANITGIRGMWLNSQLSYSDTVTSYFRNILQYPINLCDSAQTEWFTTNEQVKAMPAFPARDSIQTIADDNGDPVLVVKLGELK